MKITRVYVAGKLNDTAVGYLKNVHNMIVLANDIREAGYSVMVPCLDLLCGIVHGGMEYPDYADNNIKWLPVSDAVVVVPGSEKSFGTQEELSEAMVLGIPVFHSLAELLEADRANN